MAIGFGATKGVGSTDNVVLPYAGNSTVRSWSVWVKRNSAGGVVFQKQAQEQLSFASGKWQWNRQWSTTSGVWTFTGGTGTGSWIHLCVVYDGGSTSNTPTLYVNGAAQTTTTVTAPVGTLSTTSNNYRVGNNSTTTSVFDGEIAEFGAWDSALTTGQITQLAAKFVAAFIPACVLNAPLIRAADDHKNGAATVTGTAVTAHPPMLRRVAPAIPSIQPPISGTATLALSPLDSVGASAETFTGTASLALSPLATSAAGAETFTGTASLALSPLDSAGSAAQTFTGTASLALSPLDSSGSAAQTFTSAASLALSPLAFSAVGAQTFDGTATLALSPLASSSSGAQSFVGVGALALSPLSLDAQAAQAFIGSASLALSPLALAGLQAALPTVYVVVPHARTTLLGPTSAVTTMASDVTAIAVLGG